MYQEHFGLSRPPFKITPDTSLFFEGSQRGAALDALVYAIKSGEGIIKVVGEVGSGKTMLCRMLELRLDGEIDVVYIANPSLSPDNILHVIAHELQLDVSQDMDKVDVMQKIQAHLLQKHATNRQVVLFVEEAQSMPVETLEEIRLLSNLETDENKLLQMVLFGQPELDEKLAQPEIRQLKERITHSFQLSPFPPEDTLQYLNFRLRAVGYKGPDLFDRKTARAIKQYSGGLTRRINILADKALLAAFSEGSHTVTRKHVLSAARDSEFRRAGFPLPLKHLLAGLAFVILAAGLGYFLGRQDGSAQPAAADGGQQAAPLAAVASQPEPVRSAPARDGELSPRFQARLQATREWLASADERHYSIQLFMALKRDAAKIDAFLADIPEMLDLTKIYIYETVINQRHWYSVVYDEFASQSEAIAMLKRLPDSLRVSEPYLRRIKALKKERLKRDGQQNGLGQAG